MANELDFDELMRNMQATQQAEKFPQLKQPTTMSGTGSATPDMRGIFAETAAGAGYPMRAPGVPAATGGYNMAVPAPAREAAIQIEKTSTGPSILDRARELFRSAIGPSKEGGHPAFIEKMAETFGAPSVDYGAVLYGRPSAPATPQQTNQPAATTRWNEVAAPSTTVRDVGPSVAVKPSPAAARGPQIPGSEAEYAKGVTESLKVGREALAGDEKRYNERVAFEKARVEAARQDPEYMQSWKELSESMNPNSPMYEGFRASLPAGAVLSPVVMLKAREQAIQKLNVVLARHGLPQMPSPLQQARDAFLGTQAEINAAKLPSDIERDRAAAQYSRQLGANAATQGEVMQETLMDKRAEEALLKERANPNTSKERLSVIDAELAWRIPRARGAKAGDEKPQKFSPGDIMRMPDGSLVLVDDAVKQQQFDRKRESILLLGLPPKEQEQALRKLREEYEGK